MPEPTLIQTINLSQEEEERVREYSSRLLAKAATGVVTHPLTFVKTLFQVGYEPYSLTTGKIFVFAGREAYFLPNAFQYLKNVYHDHGFRTLFTGLDAGILSFATGGIVSFATTLYLDRYYPELGGNVKKDDRNEAELTDHESFRIHLREAIRDTVAHSVGLIISRPFTVIMVREIAQIIGNEHKYNTVLGSLYRIGYEEGPKGFFSGLVPSLIAEFITIWGCFAVKYGIERALLRAQKDNENDEASKKALDDTRGILNFAIPFFVKGFSYPFAVVSTVMSLNGSGLAVSLLPYSPSFNFWGDCYDYLKPHGLTRGARLFLREQKGAISVGHDHQLYASNKHFV